jgi:hypothetical protein
VGGAVGNKATHLDEFLDFETGHFQIRKPSDTGFEVPTPVTVLLWACNADVSEKHIASNLRVVE